MCEPIKDFKLCTCGEMKQKPQNYWILYRGEKSFEEMEFVSGSIVEPDYESATMLALQEQIALTNKLLNEGNLFDFDYKPMEGDQLSFTMSRFNHDFWFLYQNNKWIFNGSIVSFDHPEYLMKKHIEGKMKS